VWQQQTEPRVSGELLSMRDEKIEAIVHIHALHAAQAGKPAVCRYHDKSLTQYNVGCSKMPSRNAAMTPTPTFSASESSCDIPAHTW
jgi:hypothetical protein